MAIFFHILEGIFHSFMSFIEDGPPLGTTAKFGKILPIPLTLRLPQIRRTSTESGSGFDSDSTTLMRHASARTISLTVSLSFSLPLPSLPILSPFLLPMEPLSPHSSFLLSFDLDPDPGIGRDALSGSGTRRRRKCLRCAATAPGAAARAGSPESADGSQLGKAYRTFEEPLWRSRTGEMEG